MDLRRLPSDGDGTTYYFSYCRRLILSVNSVHIQFIWIPTSQCSQAFLLEVEVFFLSEKLAPSKIVTNNLVVSPLGMPQLCGSREAHPHDWVVVVCSESINMILKLTFNKLLKKNIHSSCKVKTFWINRERISIFFS